MKRNIHLVRGLPGSGKSYYAKELASKLESAVILEYDSYRYEDGVYKFDNAKEKEIKNLFREDFFYSKDENIIISNTTIGRTAAFKVLGMIQNAPFEIGIIYDHIIPNFNVELLAKRNVHNVPLEIITDMACHFELSLEEYFSKYEYEKKLVFDFL